MNTTPTLQVVILQLAYTHGVDLSQAGVRVSLALPGRPDRWIITRLDGQRISVTRCVGADDQGLELELEMVLVWQAEGWVPVELVHTDEVWNTYVQAAQAAGIPVYNEHDETDFAHFAEYWAQQLLAQGWLAHSRPVAEARVHRLAGCQSVHSGPCYGELWRCASCGKTVCCAEGTTDQPDLCDDCWSRQHAAP